MSKIFSKYWLPFFILFCVVLSLLSYGYQFGVHDQNIYVPDVKRLLDPNLYPNDSALEISKHKPSYLWYVFIPMFMFIGIENSFFILYVVSLYFTFLGLYFLASLISNSKAVGVLTVISFIVSQSGNGMLLFYLPYFAPRLFVLPFILFSLTMFVKNNYYISFLLIGLSVNLHPILSLCVLFLYTLHFFRRYKDYSLKEVIYYFLIFFISSLPTSFWYIRSITHVDAHQLLLWVNYQKAVLPLFYDYLGSIYYTEIFGILNFISFIGVYYFVSKSNKLKSTKIESLVLGIVLLLIFNLLSLYFLPTPIIWQLQLRRVARLLIPIGIVFFSIRLWSEFTEKKLPKLWLVSVLIALWWNVAPFLLVPFLVMTKYAKKYKSIVVGLTIIWSFVIVYSSILLAKDQKVWPPSISVYAKNSTVADIQHWMNSETSLNSKFIVPPYFVDSDPLFYDWRTLSHRSVVVTKSDLSEASFKIGYDQELTSKLDAITKGAFTNMLQNKEDSLMANYDNFIRKGYESNSEEDFKTLSIKYDVEYIITQSSKKLTFPIAYKNNDYTVYSVAE